MFNTTAAFYIQLPAGLYEIEAVVNQSSLTPVPNFIIQLQWGAVADTNNFLIGGLRVRKIVSSDSVNGTISRSFTYTSDSALRFSSGVLAGYPTHVVKEYDPSNVYLRPYYVSSSAVPLTTDGQTVHYTAVTEYYDTAHASFKTEYRYLADFSSAPALGLQDGAPPMTLDWLNGSLIKKTTYEQLPDSTYRPLSEEENAYIDNGAVDLYGFATQYFRPYNIATAWHMLASTVTTMYSYPNNQQKSLSATTQNYYNGNFLLSGTQTTSSKGQAINSKTWYPADYNDVSGYNIAALNSAHIMNIPIKQEISINGKIRSGSIIKYNANGFPASIYNYENAALADTVLHDPNTMLETNYVLKTNLAFDVNGNIKQVSSLTSYPVNYLWSYNYTLPIAECKNADSASIAYTSFEEVGGNWSYSGNVTGHAVTGSNCYDLSLGNITAVNTNISADLAYIVSYWSTVGAHSVNNTTTLITGKSVTVNGQTWTYYEHQISGGATGITVSGSGLIDELRLYPQNAQMTTYTYSPVIGVTSQCDVNNRITYYEYDGLGRLKLVRDQDGNIIKTIDYHYKNQ
jgi:YD repeat-containing protein